MQMQMVIPKVCTAILLTFKIYKVQRMHFSQHKSLKLAACQIVLNYFYLVLIKNVSI